MNQTHIHLLINHLPVLGSILGGLVLAHGLWTKTNQTIIAAYNLFILSAIGAVIAYLTGEGAEDAVKHLQGISRPMIEEHEDASVFALVAMITLGVVSLAGLFLTIRKSPLLRTIAFVAFFISLVSFAIIARTAYLGGQIRHTEISSSAPAQQESGEEHEDED